MGSRNPGKYYACPYCLTEITIESDSKTTEEESKLEVKKMMSKERKEQPEVESSIQAPPRKVEGCVHHFGYLSQRSNKEKIPEECIVCGNIVQCMLKNVTS